MGVTLDQILILAGRLDDSPGFDAPRERFRRFLIDHVRDLSSARALIEECQYAPGEQHQRALEDLVVLLGRFVGFKPIFSARRPNPGTGVHGLWRSRARLDVAVDVRSDQSTSPESHRLLDPSALASDVVEKDETKVVVLSVIGPLCMSRGKVEEALAQTGGPRSAGVTSLAGVLALAEIVTTARMTHEDVVRLFESNVPVEFIVHLLERASDGVSASPVEPAVTTPPDAMPEPRFWMTTVVADHAIAPEEFLQSVVAKRGIFGLVESTSGNLAQAGDWICFSIPGKGIVGHARVASLTASGGGLRDAHRFRQLVQLEELDLHLARPVAPDSETHLRIRTSQTGSRRMAQTLIGISRESFQAMNGAITS
jgi:hypothetical protein